MNKIEKLENTIVEMKYALAVAELDVLIEECLSVKARIHRKMLKEGFISDHQGPLEKEWDRVRSLLDVAQRALGFANKLKSVEQKREHQSRVMKHINRIAKELYDITSKLPSQDQQGHRTASKQKMVSPDFG